MQIQYLVALLGPVAASTASPLPSTDIPSDQNTPKCPNYCEGTAYNASLARTYVCGDSRLGPRLLPRRIPLGDLVNTYDRFGGLCPGPFLAKWYNSSAGSWIYPPRRWVSAEHGRRANRGFHNAPGWFYAGPLRLGIRHVHEPAGCPVYAASAPTEQSRHSAVKSTVSPNFPCLSNGRR